jgi:hypothetical protein
LESLCRRYGDRAQFFLVYVREAHAADGRQVPQNVRDGVIVNTPKTLQERAQAASGCVKTMKLGMPVLLDDMSNTVESAYGAWPSRACIVGGDGRFAYASLAGPNGVDPAEIERALASLVSTPAEAKRD